MLPVFTYEEFHKRSVLLPVNYLYGECPKISYILLHACFWLYFAFYAVNS